MSSRGEQHTATRPAGDSAPARGRAAGLRDPLRFVVLSAFVLLSGALLLHGYSTWTTLRRGELRRVELINQFAARAIDAVFAQLAGNLRSLGPLLLQADVQGQPRRVADLMREFHVANPNLQRVGLLRSDGSPLYPGARDVNGESMAAAAPRGLFDPDRQTVGLVIGPTLRDATGRWIVPLRYTVLDDLGISRLVIRADLAAGEDAAWLADVGLADELRLRLLRRDGRVQLELPSAASELESVYTQALPEADRRRIEALSSGPGVAYLPSLTHDADGQPRLSALQRLTQTGLVSEVSLPESLVLARWRSHFFGAAALYLAFAGGLFLVYRFSARARAAADLALRASEARFRDFADAAADWYWETDTQGRFVFISDGVARQTGISASEYIGKARWELPGNFEPSDAELWHRHRADLDARRPFRNLRYGGTPRDRVSYSDVSGKPHFDAQGRFLGYRGVASDVTELVLSQQALRRATERMGRIFDNSPVAIAVISMDSGRHVEVNQANERLYGYGREELLHRSIRDLRLWGDDAARDRFIELLSAKGRVTGFAALARRKTGELIDVEVSADLIEEGGEQLMLVTVIDVTERKRTERVLLDLNAELERRVESRTRELSAANRELEAFASSVSHDLRAPLRGIDGFARLLEDKHAGALGDEARSHLQRVRKGTQRMGRIIDDLLALSRVSRGELKLVPVDLSRMACAIADDLGRTEPQRRVQWDIAPGLRALCDPGLVHIVLDNLIGNAWKYTRRCPRTSIAFESLGRVGATAAFQVRDNGAGFEMDYAGQLFQPFRRLHAAHEYEGTGIGLATVRRVIERHGGSVSGEGRVGAGAVFTFSLPVVPEDR